MSQYAWILNKQILGLGKKLRVGVEDEGGGIDAEGEERSWEWVAEGGRTGVKTEVSVTEQIY
jgi:hypothetical protein